MPMKSEGTMKINSSGASKRAPTYTVSWVRARGLLKKGSHYTILTLFNLKRYILVFIWFWDNKKSGIYFRNGKNPGFPKTDQNLKFPPDLNDSRYMVYVPKFWCKFSFLKEESETMEIWKNCLTPPPPPLLQSIKCNGYIWKKFTEFGPPLCTTA